MERDLLCCRALGQLMVQEADHYIGPMDTPLSSAMHSSSPNGKFVWVNSPSSATPNTCHWYSNIGIRCNIRTTFAIILVSHGSSTKYIHMKCKCNILHIIIKFALHTHTCILIGLSK
jgi:hypothetical protein